MQRKKSDQECSCGSSDSCGLSRRDFVKLTATSAAMVSGLSALPAIAGPFTKDDLEHLVPVDKKLSADWVKSLYQRARGERFTSAKDELKFVGMPIGGIGCGQLYLGGDGKLWLWDVFKSNYSRERDHGQRFAAMTLNGHYTKPIAQGERYHRDIGIDLEQGFAVRVDDGEKTQSRMLDKRGFSDISFRGEYPVGRVSYKDAGCPVSVKLEAFSPFIPLNVKDSALPATILTYTVENTSERQVRVQLGGWIENKVCPLSDYFPEYLRRNRIERNGENTTLCMSAVANKRQVKIRSEILFEDFEKDNYGKWKVEGETFGDGPVSKADVPEYQGQLGIEGERAVNSHASAAESKDTSLVGNRDGKTGRLLSPEFKIERRFVRFLLGGGNHPGKTGLQILVDGNVVRSATGHNNNSMQVRYLDVAQYQGKTARIEIIDNLAGAWGNVGVDHIVFTDERHEDDLENQPGYGSMTLTLIGQGAQAKGCAGLNVNEPAGHLWTAAQLDEVDASFSSKLVGGIAASQAVLKPGQKTTATFAVSWWFPYYPGIEGSEMGRIENASKLRRYYAKHFDSAIDVAKYITNDYYRLAGTTRLWNSVWYDSTLPYWVLDRSIISLDCLATQTAHYFDNERFWGWEGVDCCAGTCQHVWNYSQANGRIFPKIERDQRENVDFGIALHANGESGHRAENGMGHFTDGQAGTIMRLWREHTISGDSEYLKRVWPSVKKAMQFLIEHDSDLDGILTGAQHNTLDAAWYGPCAWISSVYCGALAAVEQMAIEVGENDFAKKCRNIRLSGSKLLVKDLYNGEYFINKPDETKRAINSNIGCHIDQVLGQSWAMQTALPRVLPKKETVAALNSLWKYNFAPDAGLYDKLHTTIKGARVYADQGEAGLIMCTWPKGGDDTAVPGMADRVENGVTWLGPGGYFDECMTGFEYQAAAHMIYEGKPVSESAMQSGGAVDVEGSLVLKGVAIMRAVHERYAPTKRNPYNEIECSDHYARAMASYGVFLALCGFEYNGPKGYIGFAPKLSPENFKAPFTAANAWGTFSQKQNAKTQTERIDVKHGSLSINELKFEVAKGAKPSKVMGSIDGDAIKLKFKRDGLELSLVPTEPIMLKAGSVLVIEIG